MPLYATAAQRKANNVHPVYHFRTHSISTLRNILNIAGHVPTAWIIHELNDGGLELQFTYADPRKGYFFPVRLRNGEPKIYKSPQTVFSDIRKIADQAMIHWIANNKKTVE